MKKPNLIPALLTATLLIPTSIAYALPVDQNVNSDIQFKKEVSDIILNEKPVKIRYLGQSDGYESVIDWHNDLQAKKEEAVGIADEAIEAYSKIITDEESEQLRYYEDRMTTAVTLNIYNEAYEEANTLMDDLDSRMPKYVAPSYSGGYYDGPEGVLTKSAGVNSFGGRRETWYSSNILYHYRTPEWTPDENGVYRDADGYVVVAASDISFGSTVETSHGTGKVYDTGCAAGVTDIYVNW